MDAAPVRPPTGILRGPGRSFRRPLGWALGVLLVHGALLPSAIAERVGEVGELSPPDGGMTHYGSRGFGVDPPFSGGPSPRQRRRWPPFGLRGGDPDDPGRHVGLGEPLAGTSWLNRPFQIGWLVGGLFGDDLASGLVEQNQGLLGGYRLGWDFDHYWAVEGRFAFSNLNLNFPNTSGRSGTARNHFWDTNLLYYPWGDARWRPFVSLGMGLATFRYWDEQGRRINETAFALPIGLGIKYRWKKWLAVRGALTDNISFGSGRVDTMHSVSLTFGAELHFGGRRKSYFPFDTGWSSH